jgi:hypothetical protein
MESISDKIGQLRLRLTGSLGIIGTGEKVGNESTSELRETFLAMVRVCF